MEQAVKRHDDNLKYLQGKQQADREQFKKNIEFENMMMAQQK